MFSYIYACLLSAFTLACGVYTLSAAEITKLTPEPIVIHINNGVGSEKILFYKPSASSIVKVIATEASGRLLTIPQAEIIPTVETTKDKELVSVILSVKTRQSVERGAPYKGLLLLFCQTDKTQTDKAPEQFPFSIQDDNIVSIESLQATIDVYVGSSQPHRYGIMVRNNGKSNIESLSVSSSNLTDTSTGRRISIENSNSDWGKTTVGPDRERELSFDLPRPERAGNFSGLLYVTANQDKTISIPFIIRTRGPWGTTIIPFVLFCCVLFLGFYVSNILDSWINGGGLLRSQTYLSLTRSQSVLVQRFADIQQWKTELPPNQPPINVARCDLWLQQAIEELRAEIASIDEIDQGQLTADAQRFVLIVGTISLFWSAVQNTTNRWRSQPDQFQKIIAALDTVHLPTSSQDLDRYRSDLLAAMSVSTLAIGEKDSHLVGVSVHWSPETVQSRIRNMALLYKATVWSVVFLTAYQSSFAHNLSFGTLSDYLVQFAWALGLTQTGMQIVSRIHK